MGELIVDRILRDGFRYPANYGAICESLDWDGDELDIIVYSPESFQPGVMVNVRLIGALKMVDEGEVDTKLIGIHADDYRLETITDIDGLPEDFKQSITTFFSNYKN